MTTYINKLPDENMNDNQDCKLNTSLSFINKLPKELIRKISSYEIEYINYCNDYATISWEDLKDLLLYYTENYELEYFVDQIANMVIVIDSNNIMFHKSIWMMRDFYQVPGGKLWFYSDENMKTKEYVDQLVWFLQDCDKKIVQGNNKYYYKLKEINTLYKFILEFENEIEDDYY